MPTWRGRRTAVGSLAAGACAAIALGAFGLASGRVYAATSLAVDDTPRSLARTEAYLTAVRGDPVALRGFLQRLPKGADLHDHLDGAIYAERLIGWAVEDGLCVDLAAQTLRAPPCDAAGGDPALAAALAHRPGLRHDLIDAFSMRDFVASPATSAHDHFFATFGRFDAATRAREGDMLAEAADQAAADHVDYLELMTSPGMAAARALAGAAAWSEDFGGVAARLAPGVAREVERTRRTLDAMESRARAVMRCGAPDAHPGCTVTVRYLAQVIRVFPAPQVFAQVQFAYALAAADPRVVGVNLVAPEDDPTTLADYDRQMQVLEWFGRRQPGVPLSLHAGELAPGLVPPAELRGHIRKAVEIAGARRIGHGVDLAYEDDASALLQTMAARRVLVEIALTSNATILGVAGADHPFMNYRRAGVPVALASDDEGVSRGDLTQEFERAVQTYPLTYGDLKTLVRDSLEYAFIPGASLWESPSPWRRITACVDLASTACRSRLATSPRAALQARLEAELAAFEATPWPTR